MKLKNKKVLVYGMGDSGRSAIKLLATQNAHTFFYDDNVEYFDQIGFVRNPQDIKWDLVIISPGIKCLNNPLLKIFQEKNIPVISELDFAFLHAKGKLVAITGTNGKTTVSMLTAKIIKTAGFETFLCGNIGLPYSAVCQNTTEHSVTVCEVSNFQLETSKYFRADVSTILNIQPDHLDRHESFEEYVRVKGKLAQKLKRKDILILNLDDENAKKMVLHKRFMYFSKNKLKKGVYIFKNQVYYNKKPILSVSEIPLAGDKNLENVLAAVAIAVQFKINPEVIEEAVKTFLPASHRMENIGSLEGVTYIDDSKATNVASTIACVEAFKNKSIWLLLGGLGKEIDYASLFEQNFKIKQIVAFGSDRQKIAETAKNFDYAVESFDKFKEAVLFCKQNASAGDIVLLSPACASFDEFSSYAERGEKFKNLILGQADDK